MSLFWKGLLKTQRRLGREGYQSTVNLLVDLMRCAVSAAQCTPLEGFIATMKNPDLTGARCDGLKRDSFPLEGKLH